MNYGTKITCCAFCAIGIKWYCEMCPCLQSLLTWLQNIAEQKTLQVIRQINTVTVTLEAFMFILFECLENILEGIRLPVSSPPTKGEGLIWKLVGTYGTYIWHGVWG